MNQLDQLNERIDELTAILWPERWSINAKRALFHVVIGMLLGVLVILTVLMPLGIQ